MNVSHERLRRPSILGPLVLIALGILFFAGNLGFMSWSAWEALLRLWPLLLIAGGLEVLFRQRYPWAAWLIALTTVAVLLAGIWFLPGWGSGTPLTGAAVTQPLGAAERATVAVDFGAGALKLTGLDTTTNLVEGTLERRTSETIRQDYRLDGTTAIFALRAQQHIPWLSQTGRGPTWDLRLSSRVPTDLRISAGAGQSTLDLAQLQLTHVDVSTGAGQTFLTLPATGMFDASVSTGAGQTVITIPTGMAARITVSAAIGSKTVEGTFQRDGDTYVSPDFATATNRVQLDVSGGVGSILIRQMPTN